MPSTPDLGQEPRRRLGSLLLPPLAKPLSSDHKQEEDKKKKRTGGFPSMGVFRGLGCTSPSSAAHVLAPTSSSSSSSSSSAVAAVRSSAEWPPNKPRGRRKKQRKKELRGGGDPHHLLLQPNCIAVNPSDVWCAIDSSVDCVPPHFQRSRPDRPHPPREDAAYLVRVVGGGGGGGGEDLLRVSSLLLEDPQSLDEAHGGSSRHVHPSRRTRRSPGGLDELMMFQARMLLGELDVHDRYRDLRLDVDNMSYEELLELGDRIGYVNTGLREDEIFRCLRKMKHTIFSAANMQFSSELERKCSICQEEYEVNEEVGKLDCGHSYHPSCIKQWLLRKNACPVCKATVAQS